MTGHRPLIARPGNERLLPLSTPTGTDPLDVALLF